MPDGFFSLSTLATKQPLPLLPACGKCGLHKTCITPKMSPHGKGRKGILIVGENPGKSEDEQGIQFVGKTGKRLQEVLRKYDIDIRNDCWTTNATLCAAPKNKLPDAAPTHCLPTLAKTLKEFDPTIIIPLGGVAVKSLLSLIWKEDVGAISRWAGFLIPCQEPNAWIAPTYHPSFCMRMEDEKRDPVASMFFERHIATAVVKTARPWKEKPDWAKRVKRILDPNKAAVAIRKFKESKVVAIDIETTHKKPDSSDATIYSCSISDGTETISYLWHGEAIKATTELIVHPIPKFGFNVQFESRWFKTKLGVDVNNWVWDGMNNAHILDCRRGITSLKFQSFVRFGMPNYDDHIKPYLMSKGSNVTNQIREIDIDDLLTYGGLDATLEYKVAKHQAREAGYPLFPKELVR